MSRPAEQHPQFNLPPEPLFISDQDHPWMARDLFGRNLVLTEEARVGNLLRADDWRDVADYYPHFAKKSEIMDAKASQLLWTRGVQSQALQQNIKDFSPKFTSIMNRVIDMHLPQFFRDIAPEQNAREGTWLEWLAEDANEEQVLNFCQWHASRFDALQQYEDVTDAIDYEKYLFNSGIQLAIDKDYFDPSAADVISQTNNAKVIITDFWDATALGHVTGYAGVQAVKNLTNSEHATLAAFIVEPTDERTTLQEAIENTTGHELNHLFFRFGPTWVDEVMAEHFHQVFHHGQWEVVDPEQRHGDWGVYTGYRQLFEAVQHPFQEELLEGDIGWLNYEYLPLQVVSRAYSAQGEENRLQTQSEVENRLISLYGRPDVFELVATRLNEVEAGLQGSEDLDKRSRNREEAARIVLAEWKDPQTRSRLLGVEPSLSPAAGELISL
ncbi:MAG: hypothetical protein QG553_122 [Patescibacteria group bacterium]|nr:hypothetical protein [Patescibacteria group bacterium]